MKRVNSRIKIFVGILGTAIIILLLAWYRKAALDPHKEVVTLQIYVMNDVKNEEHVLAEFENRAMEELGIKVNLISQPAEKYKRELPELLDTRRNADLVFDAPWIRMAQSISEGKYLDLTEYLESGKYPGLTEAFSKEYLEANKMNGKLYGLPVTKVFFDVPGIIYRRDLLESYQLGFDSIETLEQLQAYYDAVKEENPEMIPLSVGKRGFYCLFFRDEITLMNEGIYSISGFEWPVFPAKVLLSEDETQVENVVFLGDDVSQFSHKKSDVFREAYEKQAEWRGYLAEDSLMTSDDAAEFLAGKAASYENTLGEGTIYLEQELRKSIPEARLGFYTARAYTQENLRMKKDMTAWNYICIPQNSRHVEESLKFLDWLFASQENNDLFTFGVEGVDWVQSEQDKEYRLKDDKEDRYEFPAYTMSYNPKYLRYEERLNENEKKLILSMADETNFVGSPLTGYVADCSKFQIEYQALTDLYADYHVPFMHGKYGEDTEEKIQEFHERAEELGLERVRKILITQIQKYLDEK